MQQEVTVPFNAVKVFSVSMARDRAVLGEEVTKWIRENRITPVSTIVTQSSDKEFHCISITVFYNVANEEKPRVEAIREVAAKAKRLSFKEPG